MKVKRSGQTHSCSSHGLVHHSGNPCCWKEGVISEGKRGAISSCSQIIGLRWGFWGLSVVEGEGKVGSNEGRSRERKKKKQIVPWFEEKLEEVLYVSTVDESKKGKRGGKEQKRNLGPC